MIRQTSFKKLSASHLALSDPHIFATQQSCQTNHVTMQRPPTKFAGAKAAALDHCRSSAHLGRRGDTNSQQSSADRTSRSIITPMGSIMIHPAVETRVQRARHLTACAEFCRITTKKGYPHTALPEIQHGTCASNTS